MPTAADISIVETIELLEGQHREFAAGFEAGMYALWLGSGISRDRVVGLDGVLAKLLESLRQRISNTVDCQHYKAFREIIGLAELTSDEQDQVDINIAASHWPCFTKIIDRLWNKYAQVLGTEVDNQRLDYLLWDILDFQNTFSSQEPDAEHLAIGMLVLEGVVSDLATANWDALLETAMVQLGQSEETYCVAVRGDDLRGPVATANLYKFHGCAKRAIETEDEYRGLLIARQAAINQWSNNPNFNEIRNQLDALVSRTRTLMIGLSAQDSNIQSMFGSKGWRWSDKPTPIIFSAQDLTPGQKIILEGAYHAEYEANRNQIWADATLPAFSKALLMALLLIVMSKKVESLADKLDVHTIDQAGKQMLMEGIRALRNMAAEYGNSDRYVLAQTISRLMGRFTEQFLGGKSEEGLRPYAPVHPQPIHQMSRDPTLSYSGKIEAAAALGLIGLEVKDLNWEVAVDDPADRTSGTLRICVQGTDARVFFASSDDKINGLIKSGAFDADDPDVVVICSSDITQRPQRNPSASFRNGRSVPRYLGIEDLLGSSSSFDEFRQRFLAEIGL